MHRTSYWKTTALSFAGTALALSLLWLQCSSANYGFVGSLRAVSVALAALLLTVFALITAGGVVCLWRDARERAGKADLLATIANRVPKPGFLSIVMPRFLLGPALRPGDIVRVKSRREIESTLDASGGLDGLPFMDEMAEYCDRIYRVHRRVDKINDMRNKTGLRRLRDSVTLTGIRCTGSNHDGCQAECQILWKDTWLTRLQLGETNEIGKAKYRSTRPIDISGDSNRTYICQMTALWEASCPMSPFDFRQDLRPLLNGNFRIRDYLIAILTRIFNEVQILRGGAGYPSMPVFEVSGKAPVANLNLEAGDKVVVRHKNEIAHTLLKSRNRGLWFDREMIRFCNQPAVVRKRVDRIIHEGTGKMVVMKTPCVMLENVFSTGEFLRQCPQHEYVFWREVWLRLPEQETSNQPTSQS